MAIKTQKALTANQGLTNNSTKPSIPQNYGFCKCGRKLRLIIFPASYYEPYEEYWKCDNCSSLYESYEIEGG